MTVEWHEPDLDCEFGVTLKHGLCIHCHILLLPTDVQGNVLPLMELVKLFLLVVKDKGS